jgi:hypothetical protein
MTCPRNSSVPLSEAIPAIVDLEKTSQPPGKLVIIPALN